MAEKLALKRLAKSDLSFFEYHFANETYGKNRQKGINLNTDVFVDQFYPNALATIGTHRPVLTTIFGPGTADAYSPPPGTRPITYNNGKNWRLDGGTIPDDPRSPARFHALAPGDLVLFRFRGDPAPNEVDVILVSAASDGTVHGALDAMVPPAGRQSMIPVTAAQIPAAIAGVGVPADHPLRDLEEDEEVEAAVETVALGGPTPAVLRRKRGGRRLTPEELAQARAEAGRIGADGEAILHDWLRRREAAGELEDVVWVSRQDAAAPLDFRYREGGAPVRVDAKSTEGDFSRTIHISAAEIAEAADHTAGSYHIARVYRIDEDGARVRISADIRAVARSLIDGLVLPAGFAPDGFSVDPSALPFGVEVTVERPEEPEE